MTDENTTFDTIKKRLIRNEVWWPPHNDIEWLVNRIEALEKMLKCLEYTTDYDGYDYCPICTRIYPYHFPDCELNKLLKEK